MSLPGSAIGGGVGGGGGYVDATASAVEYCETAGQQYHEYGHFFAQIATQVKDKLWHQLTVSVLDFCTSAAAEHQAIAAAATMTAAPATNKPPDAQILLGLYDKVLLKVSTKLNPLSLSRIASSVATALAILGEDRTAAKALLENLLDDIEARKAQIDANAMTTSGGGLASPIGGIGGGGYTQETATRFQLAIIYLRSQHSLLLLQPLLDGEGGGASSEADRDKDGPLLSGIRATIRKNAATLSQDLDVEGGGGSTGDKTEQALVRAAHYKQAMTYYKVVGPPEAFYEQAMLYLNYAGDGTAGAGGETPSVADMAAAGENFQLAVDLCLAALTGDGVYHLQRVVQRQGSLLSLLDASSTHAWLAAIFRAVANGRVAELAQLSIQYKEDIERQPALRHRFNVVQEKVTLLALVSFVSNKPSHERCLQFDEIAAAIHCNIDQVEWVTMRALAVGLMQGSIDEVDQIVDVTWVTPRVLNHAQLSELATKFDAWATKVGQTKEYMHEQTTMTFT